MVRERIKSDSELESNLQLSEKAAGFDAVGQDMLRNVKVLAYILKHVTTEFKEMGIEEICSYIEISETEKEVSPGRTNRVKLEHSEFKIVGEKTSVFDIFVKVRNPKLSHGTVKVYLHIDIEPQTDYKPKEKAGLLVYPIEKRGIYYLTRSLSSQLPPVITEETNYAALEKCYSIWICKDNIPLKEKNSISFYEFKNTKNIGVSSEYIKEEDYDLLSLVIIRLGSKDYEGENELIGFLNAFFYEHENKKEKLSKYIEFREEEEQEVARMKGFGMSIYKDGKEDGITEERINIIKSMYENGISLEQIAAIVKMTVAEVEELLKLDICNGI